MLAAHRQIRLPAEQDFSPTWPSASPTISWTPPARQRQTIGNVIARADELLRRELPGRGADPGRHQQLYGGDRGQAAEDPGLSHGGGQSCFDQRVPEEINRKIVDHIADINLTYSANRTREPAARRTQARYGHQDGQPDDGGAPSLCRPDRKKPHPRPARAEPTRIFPGQPRTAKKYGTAEPAEDRRHPRRAGGDLWLSGHPVDTFPRTRSRSTTKWQVRFRPLVRPAKPFGFTDYAALQCSAFAVLLDSEKRAQKTSILSFPALNPQGDA